MSERRDPPGFGSGRVAAFLVVLASLSMLGPFAIDTPFPAFPEMRGDLGATPAQMQWVVSAYLLAFAVTSPFHGPLSDAVGRKPVMAVGTAVFAAASIGCAFASSLPVLLGFRVLQGLSAGGGVIVSRTLIRDLFDGPQAQRLMSTTVMIFAIAPAIAPVIGGWLLQAGSWVLIFWFLAFVGTLLTVAVIVVLPETHPVDRRIPFRFGSLGRALATPLNNPAFHRVAWAAALSFGGQFLYIGGAAIFVVDLLGLGELDFWVFCVPMIGGMVLGSWLSGRAAGRIRGRTLVTIAMTGSAVGAVVNVVLAIGPTAAQLPWAVIGPALIAIGSGAAYPTQQLTLLDLYPGSRGSVVSLFSCCTLTLNAATASLVVPLVTDTVLHLAVASGVMVFCGLLLWLWHLRRDHPGTRAVVAN